MDTALEKTGCSYLRKFVPIYYSVRYHICSTFSLYVYTRFRTTFPHFMVLYGRDVVRKLTLWGQHQEVNRQFSINQKYCCGTMPRNIRGWIRCPISAPDLLPPCFIMVPTPILQFYWYFSKKFVCAIKIQVLPCSGGLCPFCKSTSNYDDDDVTRTIFWKKTCVARFLYAKVYHHLAWSNESPQCFVIGRCGECYPHLLTLDSQISDPSAISDPCTT